MANGQSILVGYVVPLQMNVEVVQVEANCRIGLLQGSTVNVIGSLIAQVYPL